MKRLWPTLQQLLQRLKLRLRLAVRRRLALDVMALTTGLRPVVMLDYITYSTSTMQQLCQLLFHLSQEVENVRALRVLDMEGCGYLVHPAYLVGFMERSLISSSEPVFVVLDDSSPRKASAAEQGTIMKNLSGVRQRLSSLLVAQETEPCFNPNTKDSSGANHQLVVSEDAVGPGLLVAGNITCDSGILLPTLNGWLLGYPVVYVFTESRASWAGQCVGSGTLHLYQILVNSPLLPPMTSQGSGGPMHDEDDLLSFTVPCSLSLLGSAEVWVKVFFELIARCTEQSPEDGVYCFLRAMSWSYGGKTASPKLKGSSICLRTFSMHHGDEGRALCHISLGTLASFGQILYSQHAVEACYDIDLKFQKSLSWTICSSPQILH